jgi:hypothetical protein
MSTSAVAQVYDRFDAALLGHSRDPQARWIASQMTEHPEDELLISVATASTTVFVGAASLEEACDALLQAKSELGVERLDLRGREDVLDRLRALMAQAHGFRSSS